MDWYLDVLKNKYATFDGRARRTEYWMFCLVNMVIAMVLAGIEGFINASGVISALYSLAVFIPSLALAVRRLHDTSRSGWWLLLAFVPLIGVVVLLVFMILDSTPGQNQFGENPKDGEA